jgi:hypothetical protein
LNKANNIDMSVDGAVVTMKFGAIKAGWEQWFLLMSDNHHDSIYCNRDLEIEHLEEAKKKNAKVFIFGDFFDAMQGRFDPRRSMDELRPEYRREDYYDFVVKDAVAFMKPYANIILLISDGNHELAVRKNANTDLVERLVYSMRVEHKSNVVHGGYGGWIRFLFGKYFSKNLKYFHGAGAEAPVTRGVIQTNRQAVFLPDADIVVNGHNHNAYYVPISRERISNKGKQYMSIQHHVRIPGYKQEYGDGSTGWAVTKGMNPKPIGAVWMRMWFDSRKSTNNNMGEIKLQFIPDIRGAEPVPCANGVYDGRVYDSDSEKE